MVSELNVFQCNKFHHHVSLAIYASALVWVANMQERRKGLGEKQEKRSLNGSSPLCAKI